MKICIVTHNVFKGDGQGRVNYEIVWEAIRRGHQVTLVATRVSEDLQQHPQVTWVEIQATTAYSIFVKHLIFAWKSSQWLRQHRPEFDVIKQNGALTLEPSDVNAVHFVHGAWLRSDAHDWQQHKTLKGLYQWFSSQFNAAWEKQALHNSQQIIAVSEKVKQELIDIVQIPAAKIRVIFNGVDIQEFQPGAVDRQRWQFPQDSAIGLFVGDITSSRKNLDSVLKAMVQVPDLHLAVVGAIKTSPYPLMAQTLGIADRVHFLDYRRDVPDIMRAADFLVFPSRYEACTLSLLEAMSSGLPVITASSAGGSEVVGQAAGIVLENSEDIVKLAQSLDRLTHDTALRQQMGKAARQIAENHSWQQQASYYFDAFEQSAAHKPLTQILTVHKEVMKNQS
jgi:glycosyltransferase involved in cell wall biosynthesis